MVWSPYAYPQEPDTDEPELDRAPMYSLAKAIVCELDE